ncbi:hypothetical protein CRYUN_Cryun13aG0008300 [Craigia yunnanensis]
MFDGEMNLRRWVYESLPCAVDRITDATLLEADQEALAAKTKCERIAATKTTNMATAGYMAPEYESTGTVSEKTDVYSFVARIVDLTLQQPDQENLAADKECIWAIMQVACCCIAESSDERVTMREVETELMRIKTWFLSEKRWI